MSLLEGGLVRDAVQFGSVLEGGVAAHEPVEGHQGGERFPAVFEDGARGGR